MKQLLKSLIAETALKSTHCMVKGLDLKPKVLFVKGCDKKSVAIHPGDKTRSHPLWFPKEIVFTLDQELLLDLEAAHAKGDKNLVLALWNRASRWEPS